MCAAIRARASRAVVLSLSVVALMMLAAAMGALAADRFGDVAADHAHAGGIGWVADAEVTLGCSDGSDYCPGDAVTRAQMATFMHRLAGHAPGIAPSVDAATVQGLAPAELGADTSQLEARLDALESRVDDLEADNDELQATVADQDAEISDLQATVTDQDAQIDDLESTVAEQEGQLSALQALLAGVERQDDAQGRDTLMFAGMNLQVVNGTGTTVGDPNGLGNLLIGYDRERPDWEGGSDKSGSHYLVVGDEHNYTSSAGLLAGYRNTASAEHASVSGGAYNTADGSGASVSGGMANTADGNYASVSGGQSNTVNATRASVSGGQSNTADGEYASILGGDEITVSADRGCHPGC